VLGLRSHLLTVGEPGEEATSMQSGVWIALVQECPSTRVPKYKRHLEIYKNKIK